VRILSLDAVYLPKVQRCIADIDLANAREQANHLLTLASIREIAIFLESINPAQ
jgi:phosphoenolpyruvate-protein kinase (PTS system EI component)